MSGYGEGSGDRSWGLLRTIFFLTERVLLGEAFGGDEETFARSRA
jgi:hypothetical protein